MKKKIALIMALALSVTTVFAGCGAKDDQKQRESGSGTQKTFTVGFDQDFPPMGFVGDDGEYTGFDLDLAKEVADRLDMKFVPKPISWDAKDMELSSGGIDCIWNGFTMTGREDKYTWSEPYLNNEQVFVVKKDSGIKTQADLAGKVVDVQTDSSAQKALEQQEKLQKELERTEAMSVYEKEYSDCTYICGIDEVGRGPFAGPVVAGAVILPKDDPILYLNDSKKLSEKKREALYDEIMERAVATGIGIVSPARIDEINILQATYEAMRMAIGNLKVEPDLLLNDAVTIPGVDIRQVPIIKGDAKSVSIAAASIIAKVTRDRLMVEYDAVMPGYDFAANKGYGTKKHIEGLKELGPSPIHRMTFIKKYI